MLNTVKHRVFNMCSIKICNEKGRALLARPVGVSSN